MQLACRLHYEATHPGSDADKVGNHPNAWFDASLAYHKAQKEEEGGGKAAEAATADGGGQQAAASHTTPDAKTGQ